MFKAELRDLTSGDVWGRNSYYENESDALAWVNNVKAKLEAKGRTVEVIGPLDLRNDADWVDKNIKEKRKKEFPSVEDMVEALVEAVAENKPQKLNQLQTLRQAVKNKYPKN
jgi:hypothetical protein